MGLAPLEDAAAIVAGAAGVWPHDCATGAGPGTTWLGVDHDLSTEFKLRGPELFGNGQTLTRIASATEPVAKNAAADSLAIDCDPERTS